MLPLRELAGSVAIRLPDFVGVRILAVKITYDPAKREATLRERGLDFLDVRHVFAGASYTKEDLRFDYGETRFQTVGFLGGRMVMVVWTPRDGGTHVISMRKCNDREQEAHRQQLGQG